MSKAITGPTFTCMRCLEPETVVLRNSLNMCFDCLYPKCMLCEQRHSEKVTCEQQRKGDRYRRAARPAGYRPNVYRTPAPPVVKSTATMLPAGAKRRRPILSHIMQLAEARKAKRSGA